MSTTLVPPPGITPEFETTSADSPAVAESSPQSEAARLIKAFSPQQLSWKNMDWVVLIYIVVVHVGCLAAPFFFSWSALGVAIVLHWLTASIGICLGYHRYLAHQSFELKKPAEFLVLAAGSLSAEGSPLRWAAVHRRHHHLSDQEGDPHSPTDGRWWSHLLWVFTKHSEEDQDILYRRYIPGMADRSMLQFFERTFALWLIGSGVALLGAGWLINGWTGALSMFLWAACVRMVCTYHSTWFVNSATHLWGYRNYETRDMSRNLWWVAIAAYGEGWHNNHHAHPTVAPAGHRWWEIDITWWSIKFLRAIGQAYNVKDKIPTRETAVEG